MKTEPKLIYVSGPYRADTHRVFVEQITRAWTVSRLIWSQGHVAICPHMNTLLMEGKDLPNLDADTFIKGDLLIVGRCDVVLMLPGWEDSRGSGEERTCALTLGVPVFESLDELLEYLEEESDDKSN